MYKINEINLSWQTKFWRSEITGIVNYFHHEINQRKLCSKRLSKYVRVFDYTDKNLILLSATNSGVCIISSASVFGAPVGIVSTSLTLFFSLTTEIVKKLSKYVTVFDYIDKTLIVLSATSSDVVSFCLEVLLENQLE